MKKITTQFLNLLFKANEEICVSHNIYGYKSVSQYLDDAIPMISPSEKVDDSFISEEDINLVALNPISGFRNDKNVTAYRSFLVELDDGSLESQREYINKMEMPYSVCVFSGNKSLHYGIVLDKDLVNEKYWRIVNQWILNIMSRADQQTKNPSRSIRFPDNMRHDGKKLKQSLVEIKNRVSRDELNVWLNRYPECKPKPVVDVYADRSDNPIVSEGDLPDWLYFKLKEGVSFERNATWFKYACAMSNIGFDIGQTVDIFGKFYIEESDFNRKEWISTVESAYKTTGG